MENPAIQIFKKINSLSSIFTAEATAISKALDTIDENNWLKSLILTDSLSIINNLQINGLNAYMHPVVAEIREKIHSLNSHGLNCNIMWIPAHKNISGNEQADFLAKQACNLDQISDEKIYPNDLFALFKVKMNEDTKYTYNNYRGPYNKLKGETYVNNSINFKFHPWFKNTGLSRQKITFINRIRSGHVQLNSHLNRMDILDNPECECGAEESLNHIVWECPLINQDNRNSFLSYLILRNIQIGQDIQTFAIKQKMPAVLRLIQFLTESNVFL